jgi:phage-related protein
MRDLIWVGGAMDDLLRFPARVRKQVGYVLYFAQMGERHPHAKPLKGFGGAGVLEVIEDFDGNTYRTIYTVRLRHAVYVLDCFQKKAKHGIATPRADIQRIQQRLARAEEMDRDR